MQFILTLLLTLALFYSVKCATTCLSCKDKECEDGDLKVLTCPFPRAVCVSATVTIFNQTKVPNESFDIRTCTQACPADMGVQDEASWNLRYMRVAATFECCAEDNCNNQGLPLPEPSDHPNGLMCRSCSNPKDDMTCTHMFPCQGVEDRCFFITTSGFGGVIADNRDNTGFQRGCISSNLCVNFASFFANLTEGTTGHLGCQPFRPFGDRLTNPILLTDKAGSSSLSVSSLLLSLIAFAVIH